MPICPNVAVFRLDHWTTTLRPSFQAPPSQPDRCDGCPIDLFLYLSPRVYFYLTFAGFSCRCRTRRILWGRIIRANVVANGVRSIIRCAGAGKCLCVGVCCICLLQLMPCQRNHEFRLIPHDPVGGILEGMREPNRKYVACAALQHNGHTMVVLPLMMMMVVVWCWC